MAKIADIYYKTHPWKIIEEGFDPTYSLVSESIFSLGNEAMGIRGFFEEGYSEDSLIGSYFNGIYETQKTEVSAYKGMIDRTEFVVNSVNWLFLKIKLGEETLDLHEAKYKDFYRELDLKTGVLTRAFTWVSKDGRELKLEFERFVSMKDAHLAGQKIIFTPLNFSGEVTVTAGLDFSPIHRMVGRNLWNLREKAFDSKWLHIAGDTVNTEQSVYSCCLFDVEAEQEEDISEDKAVLKQFSLNLTCNEK
ncbi:MAG TPA: family 65 glycosyl hydrolase, partial [Mobilitalea sp.]|nr:family 65 glycosyl hydrolase [Mobilitalea sp.]